jgi:hypothetical protein
MTRSTEPIELSQRAASHLIALVEVFCAVISRLLLLALLIAAAAMLLMPEYDWTTHWLPPGLHTWAIVAAVLALSAEVASFCFIARPLQNGRSSNLLVLAESHPAVPILLRPVVFLWWAAHFLLIAWIGHHLLPMIHIGEGLTRYERWTTNLYRFLFLLGVSFSSNSYLMLMAASLTRRFAVIHIVYRLRSFADVLLCIGLLLLRR